MTSRARERTRCAKTRARRASSTSVPQSCTTNGLPVASATAPEGSQCACTRSASRAARRAARANEAIIAGTSASFHGARFRFPSTPEP